MHVTISRATLGQSLDIVSLIESAYRGESSKEGWTSEGDIIDGPRTSLSEITDVLRSKDTVMFVATDEAGRLIGCAEITRSGQGCHFGKFAVDPTLQGGGVGKQLLAIAEQAAIDHFGLARMTMTVVDGRRELEAFYERRGYARTGHSVVMADIHSGEGMTIGHDLVLYEYAKDLV